MLFLLGCIGVVFIAAIVVLFTIAWMAGQNVLFSNHSRLEWLTFLGQLWDLSMGAYFVIVGALCYVAYWIGHSTGMW
jgi:hypothetical protein